MSKLSIIIPAYNERKTIKKILQDVENVRLLGVEKEIIIVDDGSIDGTREILRKLPDKYQIIFLNKNQGKGFALKKGFEAANGDICLIQDADLEYNPNDYQELIRPILEGRADVVYGSRFVGSKPHRVLYAYHMMGNKFITLFSNFFTNFSLTDIETCYKAFSQSAIKKIIPHLTAKSFNIEIELTALVSKFKFRVYEVGIAYYGRTYEEGKKIKWTDGVKALFYIIKYNLFKNVKNN